jgi:single-strand DNA-binding protein
MASVNRVVLIGNLGRDPESRQLPSGDSVVTFSLATTDSYKDKSGQKVETTEWHRVVFFGRTADVAAKYLTKGSQVYVEGSIVTKKFTDKEGNEKVSVEIKGDRMQMLGGKSGGDYAQAEKPAQKQRAQQASDFDDDSIPF